MATDREGVRQNPSVVSLTPRYDAKLTRPVHEYEVQNRQFHYHNRFGKKLSVEVSW